MLRDKHRLRVFENRVLRKLLGPTDETTAERRRVHNEEIYDLNSLPVIIRVIKSRRMRWAGHVAICGRGEVCTGFFGETRGKGLLERPRRRWEDHNKMEL
jgi:hypothetical protein